MGLEIIRQPLNDILHDWDYYKSETIFGYIDWIEWLINFVKAWTKKLKLQITESIRKLS